MAKTKSPNDAEGKAKPPKLRMTKIGRQIFLEQLAFSANVAASARLAGVHKSAPYADRRRLPEFRAQWVAALAEGYAKLEADLLRDALIAPSTKTSEAMLKARNQKDRLRINVLQLHRASMKTAAANAVTDEAAITKASFLAKLFKMREVVGSRG